MKIIITETFKKDFEKFIGKNLKNWENIKDKALKIFEKISFDIKNDDFIEF